MRSKILTEIENDNPNWHRKNNWKREAKSSDILIFYLRQTNKAEKVSAEISQNQLN